jgi:hypothetical protein
VPKSQQAEQATFSSSAGMVPSNWPQSTSCSFLVCHTADSQVNDAGSHEGAACAVCEVQAWETTPTFLLVL